MHYRPLNRPELFALIRKAHRLYQKQQYTRAFNLLTRIEKKTRRARIVSKIAKIKLHCLVSVGNITAGRDYAKAIVKAHPKSGAIAHAAAYFYAQLGEFNAATAQYKASVTLSPLNIEYAMGYALFLREMNRPEKALIALNHCLQGHRQPSVNLDASLHLLYTELAHLCFAKGQMRRALVLFTHASFLQRHFAYYDLMAECYLELGLHADALRSVELHLLNWGEGDPEVLFTHAKALAVCGEKQRALSALHQCCELWGELVVTSADMVYLYPLAQDGSLRSIKNAIIQV